MLNEVQDNVRRAALLLLQTSAAVAHIGCGRSLIDPRGDGGLGQAPGAGVRQGQQVLHVWGGGMGQP